MRRGETKGEKKKKKKKGNAETSAFRCPHLIAATAGREAK